MYHSLPPTFPVFIRSEHILVELYKTANKVSRVLRITQGNSFPDYFRANKKNGWKKFILNWESRAVSPVCFRLTGDLFNNNIQFSRFTCHVPELNVCYGKRALSAHSVDCYPVHLAASEMLISNVHRFVVTVSSGKWRPLSLV